MGCCFGSKTPQEQSDGGADFSYTRLEGGPKTKKDERASGGTNVSPDSGLGAGGSSAARGQQGVLLEVTKNLRDLGGWRGLGGKRVRFGQIFRSGHLNKPTPDLIDHLVKANVRSVVDLRTSSERQRLPNECPNSYNGGKPNEVFLPLQTDEAMRAGPGRSLDRYMAGDQTALRKLLPTVYGDLIMERQAEIAKVMRHIADAANRPCLFHCSFGQDRTGIVAALLLLILGVSEADVTEEYLVTNQAIDQMPEDQQKERTAGIVKLAQALGNSANEDITSLFFAAINPHRDYIGTALEHIRDAGGAERYFSERLGFSAQEVADLRNGLLER